MLVQEHMRQLVAACYPASLEESRDLWSNIKPVKYGLTVEWDDADEYTLANYQIPDDASYHLVLRVECYTVNLTSGATDYGLFEPPPPGTAFWRYLPFGTGATYDLTDVNAQPQIILDCDEFLVFKGGYNLALIGNLDVAPDGETRNVRTLIYGYDCGPVIANRLGCAEMVIAPQQ
jgi:hypothetical protein